MDKTMMLSDTNFKTHCSLKFCTGLCSIYDRVDEKFVYCPQFIPKIKYIKCAQWIPYQYVLYFSGFKVRQLKNAKLSL